MILDFQFPMLSVADLEVKTSSQNQGFEINRYFEIKSNSFVLTHAYKNL
jgi:hypothetical protein